MEPLNPVQIERDLRETNQRIYKGVEIVSKRYAEFLKAKSEYEDAQAYAFLAAEGSIKDKDAQATIATKKSRDARDVADAAYRRAKDLLRAVEGEQSALQTISAGIRQAYAGAHHGTP